MSTLPFNRLTHAEVERLAILSEELGEAQQIIGKILRHGMFSYSPLDENKVTNQALLEKELGDIVFAMRLMGEHGDLLTEAIEAHAQNKAKRIQKYLHHNEINLSTK